MIQITHVDQDFRVGFWLKKSRILHDVTLSVPRGGIFGFLGANGAGKTTLIHLITGLRKPVQGEVRIAGRPASSPEARARIGYLPERPYFYEHLTGEGLLYYFGALSGMSRGLIRERIPGVLEEVGLADKPRKLELRRYSKGMLQRIGIAQALLHDPEVLVLDEPMSGLDPVGRKDVRELLLRLAGRGKTIFFSSHVIPDVEAICTRVGLIDHGRMIGEGSISDLLSGKAAQIEIAFSGIDPSGPPDSGMAEFSTLQKIPEGWRGYARDHASAQKIIEALVTRKAAVLWVVPHRPSLEDLFL